MMHRKRERPCVHVICQRYAQYITSDFAHGSPRVSVLIRCRNARASATKRDREHAFSQSLIRSLTDYMVSVLVFVFGCA